MPKSCLTDERVDDRRIWELKKSGKPLKKEQSIEELMEAELLRHDLEENLKIEQQLSIEENVNGKNYILWFKRAYDLDKKTYSWFYMSGSRNTILFREKLVEKYQKIEQTSALELEQELDIYNKTYSGNTINF